MMDWGVGHALAFGIGVLVGIWIQRIYGIRRARWLDKHAPLPGGRHHEPPHLNRVRVAGIVTALVMGYVLFQAQAAHDQAVHTSNQVAHCAEELITQARVQIEVNRQNDLITRQQAALQGELNVAEFLWIHQLIAPDDPQLAALNVNAPQRTEYSIAVTQAYAQKMHELQTKNETLVAKRARLDDEREKHPLPEPTCSK